MKGYSRQKDKKTKCKFSSIFGFITPVPDLQIYGVTVPSFCFISVTSPAGWTGIAYLQNNILRLYGNVHHIS